MDERGVRGYNKNMLCIRCGNTIKRKSKKYCSLRCQKLYLKKLYRERNKDKIRAYAREWKKRGIRGNPSTNKIIKSHLLNNPYCARCGIESPLHICHIKPRDLGGKNKDNLITLCPKCHYQFDNLLWSFWGKKRAEKIKIYKPLMEVIVDD